MCIKLPMEKMDSKNVLGIKNISLVSSVPQDFAVVYPRQLQVSSPVEVYVFLWEQRVKQSSLPLGM